MKQHILALLAITSLPAFAGPPTVIEPTPTTDDWSYRIALPIWAAGIDGTVGVRGLNVDVDASFSDLAENLDLAFALATEIRRGRWGFLADFTYSELSDSGSTPKGIAFSLIDVELKQFIGNIALAYRMVENDRLTLDLYGGVRVNWVDTEVTLSGNTIAFDRLNRSLKIKDRSISADESWVDPIVGLRGNFNITDKVFLRGLGDVGGFGVGSDFSWQAMGLVGYRFTGNFSAYLGYRGVGSDFTDGDFRYDLVNHGPVIGIDFSF